MVYSDSGKAFGPGRDLGEHFFSSLWFGGLGVKKKPFFSLL